MDGLDGYIRVGWGIDHLVVLKFFRVQETDKSNRNALRESWMCATWLLNGSLSTSGHLCDFIKQGATHLGIFSNHESRKGKINAFIILHSLRINREVVILTPLPLQSGVLWFFLTASNDYTWVETNFDNKIFVDPLLEPLAVWRRTNKLFSLALFCFWFLWAS